jgi:hypothetical protein
MSEYGFFALFGITQLIHSQEEIWTGFHKRYVPGLVTAPIFLIVFAFYFAGLVQAT